MRQDETMTTTSTSFKKVNFSPRRLGHANFSVSSFKNAVDFYSGVCGFEEVAVEAEKSASFVSNGNTHHDFGFSQFVPTGLNHVGWELDTEVDLISAIDRAKSAGCENYFMRNHTFAHSFYVRDPDGNTHEFYADVMSNWRKVFSGGEIDIITSNWAPGETPPRSERLWHENPEIRSVPTAPIHPQRTSRVVFVVSDFDRLLEFYTDFAGLQVVYAAPDKSFACLRGSAPTRDFHCAIFTSAHGLDVGFHHVSCVLPSETSVEEAEFRLVEQGIKPVMSVDNVMKRSFFIRDPDGLLVEFYCMREPDFASLSNEPPEKRISLA